MSAKIRQPSQTMVHRRFDESLSYYLGKRKTPPKGYGKANPAPPKGDIDILRTKDAIGCIGMWGGEINLPAQMKSTIRGVYAAKTKTREQRDFITFWDEVRDIGRVISYNMTDDDDIANDSEWVMVDKDHFAYHLEVAKAEVTNGYVKPSEFTPVKGNKKTTVAVKAAVKKRAPAKAPVRDAGEDEEQEALDLEVEQDVKEIEEQDAVKSMDTNSANDDENDIKDATEEDEDNSANGDESSIKDATEEGEDSADEEDEGEDYPPKRKGDGDIDMPVEKKARMEDVIGDDEV